MAKLSGNIQITGTLDNLSFYKMRGVDKIVVRRKSGPTKKQIKTLPAYENTRRSNSEWIATTRAAQRLRRAMNFVTPVADFNISGPLNALTRKILKLSETGTKGQRPVLYSKHRDMLAGYNFNQQHLFDTIVRSPVLCNINRETGTATIHLPSLEPNIQIKLPWKQPVYRFVVQLGIALDCKWDESKKAYKSFPSSINTEVVNTEWHSSTKRYEGQTIELVNLSPEITDEDKTFVVSIALEMGNLAEPGKIDRVKYAGSGKILALG